MSTLMILSIAGAAISAQALAMAAWNLTRFRVPGASRSGPGPEIGPETGPGSASLESGGGPLVSICIPARNEQVNIEACVRGLLAQTHADVEVLVYDDQSTDETPRILERLEREDSRVRRVATHALPAGWNGKQHACWRMAQAAKGEFFLFTDADVRFEPGAVARSLSAITNPERQRRDQPASAQVHHSTPNLGLVSTFPRQVTATLPEHLVVPMIFFILFSYLPFVRMQHSLDPSASAGCGQFLFVSREAYFAAGTHEAFKDSMHDGIKLPRLVRKAGFATDLFDATDQVSCRMYFGWRSTWRGFAKNAYEGLGSVGLLVFLTVMHLVGHVLPWGLVAWGLAGSIGAPAVEVRAGWIGFAMLACALQLVQRGMLASRLKTSMLGAALHPLGVVLMTAIQWHSFVLHLRGKRSWRGRDTAGNVAAA